MAGDECALCLPGFLPRDGRKTARWDGPVQFTHVEPVFPLPSGDARSRQLSTVDLPPPDQGRRFLLARSLADSSQITVISSKLRIFRTQAIIEIRARRITLWFLSRWTSAWLCASIVPRLCVRTCWVNYFPCNCARKKIRNASSFFLFTVILLSLFLWCFSSTLRPFYEQHPLTVRTRKQF